MSLRPALGLGGLFAVSTVLPDQIEHLAVHLITLKANGWLALVDHLLPLIGSFLLLSVTTWLAEPKPAGRHPLAAYPPHFQSTVLAHSAGLSAGIVLLLTQIASH